MRCRARRTRSARRATATRKGRRKVVRYWLMEPDDGRRTAFSPNHEVDEVRWCTALEAAKLLSYAHDRKLLRGLPRRPWYDLYLVRHAKAGARRNWRGADEQRPLSKPGRQQSEQLADVARRRTRSRGSCRARTCGASRRSSRSRRSSASPSSVSDALAEGAPLAESVALLEKLLARATWCSAPTATCWATSSTHVADRACASTTSAREGQHWVLECADGEVRSARYVPPRPDPLPARTAHLPATNWRQLRLLETHE